MPSRLPDRGHGQLPGLEQEDRQDEYELVDTTPSEGKSAATNGAHRDG